uniref:Proline rich 12b n=1 Tax=Oryzias latipes TaxID=8090 RepID=A0A3P9HNN0_ORYLA
MDRNFPAAGFGELGAGAGWTYDRKPSLMYGSSRSSHPDSELLHRQAYAPPHPLQGYSTNHHPGRQGGGWGTAGRTIGLSGLFDASLHHAGPSAPDPSVMNLISALDSRGPQSAPPASSLLSQFRNPSWQTGMHTPAPADLFIAGTLPGSSSFPSSSALSAYQPPGSFSGRSFTPSLSLQDAPTYSPSSSSLLSPHDSLLHIKTPSQSSLGFDRLLPSQSAAYRGSHEPSVPPHAQTPSSSSSCHLPSPKFNLLSSHLHNRSSQLYNTSMFSSSPGLPPAPSSQPQTPSEMAISRHDSVIKHYQRSSPAQSSALQQYASYGGSSEYHQAVSHHRHAGVSCSPLGEQSPPTDPKLSPQMESQTYSPIIPTPYSSSSSGHSASSLSVTKGNKSSSSTSGYSSSGSASSSSQNPHTPPSASSTSSSCSSSSKTSNSSFSVPSCQQLPSQSATAPPPQSGVSSTLMQHTAAKQCLSSHASQSVAKSGASLSDSTPPQHHSQPYSPNQPPSTHITQPYRDFSSPHTQDMSTTAGSSGGKVFTGVPPGGRSFSAEIIYEDSSFGSTSLKRSSSPSLGYGSESAGSGHASSVAAHSSGVGSAGSGSGAASIGNESNGSFHPPDCSTPPSVTSALTHPALPSPAANECLSQSPGAPGSAKYLPPYPIFCLHTETNLLAIDRSRDEEESSDFLIHHLLNTQSSSPHLSQLHSRPQQLPQSLSQSRYGEGKGMTYDLEKASDEHYHAQSVIRTGNATSSSGPETSTCDTASVSNRHLETSQMKQQTKIGLAIPNSTAGVLRGAEPVSHSQHNELGSVVHYGRGDLYPQHSHSQHSHHTSHISSHSQQHTQHPQQISQHSQHSQQSLSGSHSHSNSHAQQNQAPHSLMDSSPNPPHPSQSSLISHNTHSKMESQQSLSKQHSLNQAGMVVGSSGGLGSLGLESHSQSHSSQLQLHLQNQSVDTCFNLAGQPRNPTQTNQNSMSSLEMLEQSLSCANSMESGGPLDTGGTGVTIPLRKDDGEERPRQHHKLTPHHQSQQKGADIHDFLAAPDMSISPSSHLHCLNQPPVHAQSHGPHDQQTLTHHQMTHAQMSHHHPHQIALKQHQFDSMTVADKVRPHQGQQQRYPPMTSICFPDSLLQDEGRAFFPEMEDIFCSSEFKSSCVGDCRAGQIGRDSLSQARQCVKSGGTGEDYGVVGSPSDQSYGQYCHNMLGQGSGNLHLDLDSLKTHELPSTVNTEQLGLIQSQTPTLGLGSGESSVSKMMGAVGGSSNTSGLTSPIFCSTRPKKLLKTSSFHLLKQRREPQPQTKKNYAQEYEFEDDEDKADVPADIRLNTRRLPDLLPDLVSSCRRGGGASGVSGFNPVIGDLDFCRSSSYSSLGNPPQLPPHDGPKKRGRKPTKPKREGPPRPRGRPRIRPLPEPPYCRGLTGSVAGETRRGRGRGRGRVICPEAQRQICVFQIKLPFSTIAPSESLLRTDSLSSSEPVLSDGSLGSAPSLGLSPGPSSAMEISRSDLDQTQDEQQEMEEKKTIKDFKPGFMASFLDFLKAGKKPELPADRDGCPQENLDTCCSLKGGIRPLSSSPSSLPSTPPPQPTGTFSDEGQGEGEELALSGCPSPCKPLDEELKGNLEALPSFSSDEEDSVSKNQDLQKSISSAISALYDTPHSLAAAMASAMMKAQPPLTPTTPQEPSLSPPISARPPPIPDLKQTKEEMLPCTPPRVKEDEEQKRMSSCSNGAETKETEHSDEEKTRGGQEEVIKEMLNLLPSPLSNLPLSLPIPPPSTTPPPSSSDQDQDPEAGQPSPSSPSSSSSSSQPPSPPTPEEAPASQRLTALHLAKKQADAAIAGESEEEDSESGGEGIFRERDEFVVRTEDIGTLKMALQTGREPPPIWRVQKALLQKFSPEIKDGQRQFCATSNYLGYFGDAKMRYQRLYVKFLENVNKKDYVRVCSRKPWHRAGLTLRYVSPKGQKEGEVNESRDREQREQERERKEKEDKQRETAQNEMEKQQREQNERERQEKEKRKDREPTEEEKQSEQRENKRRETERESQSERERGDGGGELMRAKEEKREERKVESQSRSRMLRDKAEPPPKKRKKWLKEVPSSSSDSDSSIPSDDEGRCVCVGVFLCVRAMREMFRSYVEMLVSTALDPDMIQALEDTDDELYLPPMRKIDSLLSEQKKRLLGRVNMSSQHQEALQLFPKMTADPLESGAVRVHLGGEGYNRKTLNRVKKSISKQQDMKLSIETCRIYSLYHSLHHYKYHTFLHCKKETDSIEQAAEDPGQEEVVQQCMANQSWLESLFNSFVELLSLSCKA